MSKSAKPGSRGSLTTSRLKKDPDLAAGGLPLTQEEQNIYLVRQVEALKLRLIKAENKSTISETAVREIRQKLFELQKDYEDEKNRSYALACDMTRQYKRRVDDLLREKEEQIQIRRKMDQQIQDITRQKDQLERDLLQRLALKEAEILEQKHKMDEMAHEFGVMLKATLDKMSEKIEITNDWDHSATTSSSSLTTPMNAQSQVGLSKSYSHNRNTSNGHLGSNSTVTQLPSINHQAGGSYRREPVIRTLEDFRLNDGPLAR
jgi:hypothetical protein